MQPDAKRSTNHSHERSDGYVQLTVQEAATALNVTVEAVRGRMHRGKYKKEKAEDGTVYVLLTPDQLPNGHQPDDERSDNQTPNVGPEKPDSVLLDELHDRVRFLEAELAIRNEQLRRLEEARVEESRRSDHIIAGLMQRVPVAELESTGETPREAPERPQNASEGEGGTTTGPAERADEPRASWWRRFFGFE
jgi:hypothetical protein